MTGHPRPQRAAPAATGMAAAALERAARHAPFLRGLIHAEEALVALLEQGRFDEAVELALARLATPPPATAIRRARAGIALTVAIADLAGAWPLERVTAALSDFADRAIEAALGAALSERGIPSPQGLAILALGKLGSRELNYSSDVDLIALHDPARLAVGPGRDPDEEAIRIVRRMTAFLAERTADGYGFRVDLRLRPDPDSTPLSLRLAAAESYYQSQALMWERSAFIRARPVAGDLAMGAAFLAGLDGFIWRRSLDYSAIAEIGEVSVRIREHYGEVERFGPGYDLKRGRGGIREVEFFAAVHQLVHGGREPALRAPATLDALAALARAGRIGPAEAATLASAYRDFRTLEHRLQMVADQQTHTIPRLAAERRQIAGLMGAAGWEEVARAIEPQTRAVARLYDRLLRGEAGARAAARIPLEEQAIRRWAAASRIAEPELLAQLLSTWRSGRPRSLRAPEALAAFEAVAPRLVKRVASGRMGRAGLVRLDTFVKSLPSGVQFWRLLEAHPSLADLLARLLSETPYLADALAARPDLFDVAIDPPAPLASLEAALEELPPAPATAQGLEPFLDRIRRATAERRFRIGIDLIEGRRDALDAAAELSLLAEAAIVRVGEAVTRLFEARHGRVPGSELVTLGLGRLGGRALTPQSDLDLVFVFTGDFAATSDGENPLGASTYFNRLAQRLVSALSAPTAQGPLYAVDTRLRPSGAQGLLAVSLRSFERYQEQEAELWETLALTRARPISGSPEARAAVGCTLERLLSVPRDPSEVRRHALEMRLLMETHKPPAGPWDVKLIRGGLVDLEFVIGARALERGLRVPTDLDGAAAMVAPDLRAPHRLLMTVLVLLRLILPASASASPDAAATALLARTCGNTGVAKLRADLLEARRAVLRAFDEQFGTRRG
ncbi:bifunctional [glutamate--ammonia ligase]-adenylyl-L-tyrosine phosphorylase/[glutamate--ammonia-ligase] adenylyltransferase [Thermaurantiacus sp.]